MTILLALVFDWLLGEPPNEAHPVAWLGRLVSTLERRAPHDNPHLELLYGAFVTSAAITSAALPALLLQKIFRKRGAFSILVFAFFLKITFAWRALIHAGNSVRRDLETHGADAARADLRALVSRDTTTLDESRLAAAAIESLAENASDSFVAPIFYYHLFGLAGASIYRAVNTLDAMLGYHGRYEFLGKVPARLDDALNLIPARLTAALIVIAARSSHALAVLRRDRRRTASPNAGYPMSAMAGALNVRLEKTGQYILNARGRAPSAVDIAKAARIVNIALLITAIISLVIDFSRRHSSNDNPSPD
jgi:adenosylcobinamide-phosphate synthase